MIGGKGIERNVFFIPVIAGHDVKERVYKLDSQQTPIQGVTVDNQDSSLVIHIYSGLSPNGTPYIVRPGKSVSIGIARTSAIYVKFIGVAKADGVIYISVSEAASELFANSSGAATVDTSTPLDVNVVGGLPDITVNFPIYPPTGSLFVQESSRQTFTAATMPTRIELSPGPGVGSGMSFFVFYFETMGLNRQPWLQWRFRTGRNVGDFLILAGGYGDTKTIFPAPYLQRTPMQSNNGLFFDFLNNNAIIGTLNWFIGFSGYWAPPGTVPIVQPI